MDRVAYIQGGTEAYAPPPNQVLKSRKKTSDIIQNKREREIERRETKRNEEVEGRGPKQTHGPPRTLPLIRILFPLQDRNPPHLSSAPPLRELTLRN